MNSTKKVVIMKMTEAQGVLTDDIVVVEEPLEIRLSYTDKNGQYIEKPVSITMRTPTDDEALALGFLFTEGIIQPEDVLKTTTAVGSQRVTVHLKPDIDPDLARLQRNFYATSSCGVCGKSSLDALEYSYSNLHFAQSLPPLSADLISVLPQKLLSTQSLFELTGGIHAAGVFDWSGALVWQAEDVGRHNAVDKIAGYALKNGLLPFNQHLLVLSGRACFELLHKALALSIPVVVAVGAPSSLAIETAQRFGQTLIGFTREGRFNVYTGKERTTSEV